jgi:FkbM family methyltransferase
MIASFKNRFRQRFGVRMSWSSRLPKADLRSCLLNLAERGFNPKRLIDVGANKGSWSTVALDVFRGCTAVMIEPQAEMEAALQDVCERHPGCSYIIAGAGAREGTLDFTVYPDTVSSSFCISQEQAASMGLERRRVPIVTLDRVVRETLGVVPEIVKIDAEGFEAEVIQGAQSLLGKTEVVFLEAHMLAESGAPSGFVELVKTMSDYGYAPYDFTWFGRRPHDRAIMLAEVAFARTNGQLRSKKGWV